VSYYEPEPILLVGKGFYPSVQWDIPREEVPEFKSKFDEEFEKKKIARENEIKRSQLMA
jgi:hypothetical protein